MSGPCRRDIAANQGERDDDTVPAWAERWRELRKKEEIEQVRRALQPDFEAMIERVQAGEISASEAKAILARSEYRRG